MRIIGMGILAAALVTGCAFEPQDELVNPGVKHQVAGDNSGADRADGTRVIPSTTDNESRDGRPKPPAPPGDPEPSPWKFAPSGEPEPSPWGGPGQQGGPATTGNDPTNGHRDAKLTQGVLDQY